MGGKYGCRLSHCLEWCAACAGGGAAGHGSSSRRCPAVCCSGTCRSWQRARVKRCMATCLCGNIGATCRCMGVQSNYSSEWHPPCATDLGRTMRYQCGCHSVPVCVPLGCGAAATGWRPRADLLWLWRKTKPAAGTRDASCVTAQHGGRVVCCAMGCKRLGPEWRRWVEVAARTAVGGVRSRCPGSGCSLWARKARRGGDGYGRRGAHSPTKLSYTRATLGTSDRALFQNRPSRAISLS